MHWPDATNPMMLLGRLLERSDETIRRLDRIDGRLREGDSRMDAIDRKLEAKSKPGADMPAWERAAKLLAPYLIVGVTAWATGSLDKAIEIAKALR